MRRIELPPAKRPAPRTTKRAAVRPEVRDHSTTSAPLPVAPGPAVEPVTVAPVIPTQPPVPPTRRPVLDLRPKLQEAPDPLAGRPSVHDATGRTWIVLPGVEDGTDWPSADLDGSALTILRAVAKGVPERCHLLFHDDVTALHGIDLEMVETACRRPHRVEIAPETGVKKYPVLKFWRGDVLTVVGFREPQMPKIIAAYVGGLSLHDTHSADSLVRGSGSGGGSRRAAVLPSNVNQLLKRLTGLGVAMEESADGKTQTVTFWGQEIGKITANANAPRDQVQSDFQRMCRRMEAIKQKEAKTG
jgi:hypothetical protein